MSDKTKKCSACKKQLPVTDFYTVISNGKKYFRSKCKKCGNRHEYEKFAKGKPLTPGRNRYKKRYKEKLKRMRRNNEDPARWIYEDSKGNARKKEMPHTISKKDIEELIANGCDYCGETELKMTLDRVNNNKGYIKENVEPCCIRCNYIKRDMPHEAWEILKLAVKEANDKKLFGSWMSQAIGKNNGM
ncbi:MAG TPA: hypothetical protein ENH85_12310 [Candidatus Scalindua sp.]|nr:hypothetical protein [Candidatus Scalindua sp.]